MHRLTRAAVAASLLLLFLGASVALAQPPRDKTGFVKFRGAAFPVAEEAEVVEIVVKRLGGSDGAVSVAYETTEGTATEGEDYEATDGVLEWEDGDRSDKTFEVVILDDDEDEGQETFGLRLFDPSDGLEIKPPSTAVVRIKPSDRSDDGDDDEEEGPGEIELTSEDYTSFEVDGTATFKVEREDGSVGEVSVEWMTMDGSAEAGSDYVADSGILTWADGEEGDKEVTIDLIDDTDAEDTETLMIILSNPTGGATLGSRSSANIQIIDNDGGSDGDCVPDDFTMCLQDGRFQITGTWEDFEGNTGDMVMLPASDETGFVWFFDEDNFELLLKVLDACSFNQHFWFFYAATTNVGFTLEVEDLQSGEVKTYVNPVGVQPTSVTDTAAFATCDA